MELITLVTLKYVDANGRKVSVPANHVIADHNTDDAGVWIDKGFVRKATVGEVAEAKAANKYRALAAEKGKGKGKTAAKTEPEKSEPAKTEPAKTEPVKAEPAKVETGKGDDDLA